MQTRKQKLLTTGAVVITVLLLGGGVWIALESRHDSSSRPAISHEDTSGSAHVASPPFTAANSQLLVQALSNSDKNEQAKALVPQLRTSSWQADAVLPAGATIAIDPHSFALEQDGQARVNVTVSGTAQGSFVLHLTDVGGTWLINTTEMR